MREVFARIAVAGLLSGGLLVVSPVRGQDVKPAVRGEVPAKPETRTRETGVHQIEVINGPVRTIHYFSTGLSRSDQGTLRDVERGENEMALNRQLLSLRRQYLTDERAFQDQRRLLMQRLATQPIGVVTGVYPDEVIPIDRNGSLAFANTNLPTFPANLSPGLLPGSVFGFHGLAGEGFGGYQGSGGYPTNGGISGLASLATAVAALELSDQQPLKRELARTFAAQATPEYSTRLGRHLEGALSRAAASRDLQAGLGLPDTGIRAAATEQSIKVTVTTKGGTKVSGNLVREDDDWVIVDTGASEVEVRKSEATMIEKPRK